MRIIEKLRNNPVLSDGIKSDLRNKELLTQLTLDAPFYVNTKDIDMLERIQREFERIHSLNTQDENCKAQPDIEVLKSCKCCKYSQTVNKTFTSLKTFISKSSFEIIIKSLDPLRAKKTFIRRKLGHTMVSAIKASSVTL